MTLSPSLWQKRPTELCQLARDWQGEGGGLVEQKHDGWRFLWIRGQAFTRNGMPFRGTSHIERALAHLQRHIRRPMFFDGEFVVGTGLHTLAQTKAHQDRGWRDGDAGTLWLFDAVPLDEWEADDCPTPLLQRKQALQRTYDRMLADPLSWEFGWGDGIACPIQIAGHQIAESARQVRTMACDIWEQGGEGVMVKDPASLYRRNRNDDWQKLRIDIEKRGKTYERF